MFKKTFLIFLLFCLPQMAYSQPPGTDQYTWDFGQIKEGEVAKHTFIFKNNAQTKLNILSTNSSCGCTSSQVDKQVLLPEETANIEVAFNSQGYFGLGQQFVYLHTDDVKDPVIKFTIKADVVK